MQIMKAKSTLALIGLLAGGFAASGQEVFTTFVPGLADDAGRFNYARVRINATLDGTALGQWSWAGGLCGITANGEVWSGFGRYKMFERDLFSAISDAGQVTVTTGLIAKTRGSERGNDFGIPVEVFLALDPSGQFIPSGSMPDIFNAWDWADELGYGYTHTVSLGIVQPTDYDMADQETLVDYAIEGGGRGLTVGHPAMQIVFDLTPHLQGWLDAGLLTADSSIAIGFYQRLGNIVDENGAPDPLNPSLLPAQNEFMLFEVVNMHLTVYDVAQVETWAGFAIRADGWVDTGDFLGLVYPVGDYIYILSLEGWMYLPEAHVEAEGAWGFALR